ncbi:hypothetical protein [Bordetella bronchialis]|uniref:Uncharacterized protein n=1 Tax=Bordetella bronchialis TaxID=463025 RepID=A0A193FX08_9BORD|nr:hypothetical protein [Bordetella bronchialis]ANN66817.1 hypothetical protein BAU06_11455 [Bordetella bronchialis]ANN71893.1 hypothetical protein BAU08_11650 [Bordetella bronchialis]
MKNIATALLGFALLSTAFLAASANESGNVPTAKSGAQKAATGGSCVGADAGIMRKGYVASVASSWLGDTNISIAFRWDSSDELSAEWSAYRNDSAEGAAQYNVLMSAYLSGIPVTLYCAGRNYNGKGSFSSVWLGETDAP